jgi:hypothetical protein
MTRTVEAHPHAFDPEGWPFSEPVNALAYSTTRAIRGGEPFLLVSHDHDGDWQFLCGDLGDDEEGLIVCLGCAYERDPSLAGLSDLPIGWQARRGSVEEPWQTFPYEAPDENED